MLLVTSRTTDVECLHWQSALNHSIYEHVWACGNSSLPVPSLPAFSFVLLSQRFQTRTFPSLLDQHPTLSPTLYSIICLFIEDNWRWLLVRSIVGTRARAVKWTSAATTRRKHELLRVCFKFTELERLAAASVQVYCIVSCSDREKGRRTVWRSYVTLLLSVSHLTP